MASKGSVITDRAGGGNRPAYAAAQAAHAQLRTPRGRSEALADLAVLPHVPLTPAPEAGGWHALFTAATVLPATITHHGRPRRAIAP